MNERVKQSDGPERARELKLFGSQPSRRARRLRTVGPAALLLIATAVASYVALSAIEDPKPVTNGGELPPLVAASDTEGWKEAALAWKQIAQLKSQEVSDTQVAPEEWMGKRNEAIAKSRRLYSEAEAIAFDPKRQDEALHKLYEAQATDPRSVAPALLIARVHESRGNWSDAELFYLRFLSRNNEHLQAILGISDVLMNAKGYHDAGLWLKQAQRLAPDDPAVRARVQRLERETKAEELEPK